MMQLCLKLHKINEYFYKKDCQIIFKLHIIRKRDSQLAVSLLKYKVKTLLCLFQ